MIYLITGKAGAGKTHYAKALKKELEEEGRFAEFLDGDDQRIKLGTQDFKNKDNYTDEARIRNLMYAAELAKRYELQGKDVVLAFIAPRKEWRYMMRVIWKLSKVIYIPGGSLWEGTTYEKPTMDELVVLSLDKANIVP